MTYRDAFSLFKVSKDAVLNNPLPFFVLYFLPSFLMVVADAMNGGSSPLMPTTASQDSAGSISLSVIGVLASLVFLPAVYCLELQSAKGKKPSTEEVLRGSMRYFWRLLGLLLVLGVMIVFGLLALIVPGIIFIKWYFFAPYYLVAQDLSITDALKASKEASKGHGVVIWTVAAIIILFSILSIIPVFGGLISLVLLTLYTCAPAYLYYELSRSKAPKLPVA